MGNRHVVGPQCPLCEEKAATLCDELKPVWRLAKERFPAAHISWAWRSKEMQDFFFSLNRSKVQWPNSRHNTMKDGLPWAEAFDLFELRPDGVPAWPLEFFRSVNAVLKEKFPSLEWGGVWKFRDGPHFQLRRSVDLSAVKEGATVDHHPV